MKYFRFKYILLSTIWLLCLSGYTQKSTRIAVINDIHYFSDKLAATEKAKENYTLHTSRDIDILHEVLDTVIARILLANPDVLLIAGDITNHGERQSHIDFIEKMQKIRDANISIFVVPGNHDINIPNTKRYNDNEILDTETVSASEFAELYADFGYNSAINRDTASLSYLAKINDQTYLICFDTNRYDEHKTSSISAGKIKTETLHWALEILKKAKQENINVIAMMHHGLVEHIVGQSMFFPAYLIENWQTNAQKLADAGIKAVFTGHFHANDVTSYTSPTGSTITDIETAGIGHFPFSYRIMELSDTELKINTYSVNSISSQPDLAQIHREKLHAKMLTFAKNRLKSIFEELDPEAEDFLVSLVAQMAVLHSIGDEVPDEEMKKEIETLSQLFDNDYIDNDFSLDFPPEDNNLIIKWEN